MIFKKLISILLIITFVLGTIVPLSYADEICFTEASAKTLDYNLAVCDDTTRKYISTKQENSLLTSTIKLQEDKMILIEKDKEVYKKQSEDFKKQFLLKDEAYQKAIASKPSRATWFLFGTVAGSLTTLGLIVLGLLSVK